MCFALYKKKIMNIKGHVYIVTNKLYPESVYKIGMSKNIKQRMRSYGKDRNIHKIAEVPDCLAAEKKLLDVFAKEFKLFRGKETFEGDISKMSKIFDDVCSPKPQTKRLRFLPTCRGTWLGFSSEVSDPPPTLKGYVRKSVQHFEAGFHTLFPECFDELLGDNIKYCVISGDPKEPVNHRFGNFCLMKGNLFGKLVRNIRNKCVIIDLGYADVYFRVLDADFLMDYIFCVAEEWPDCPLWRPIHRSTCDKRDFLEIEGTNFATFGEQTQGDPQTLEMLSSLVRSGDYKNLRRLIFSGMSSTLGCDGRFFNEQDYIKNLSFSSGNKPIKEAFCVEKLCEQMRCSEGKDCVSLFGKSYEVLLETDEEKKNFKEWKKYGGDPQGISTIVRTMVEKEHMEFHETIFGTKNHPWSHERLMKMSTITESSHKSPPIGIGSCINIDIVIHTPEGPVCVFLFGKNSCETDRNLIKKYLSFPGSCVKDVVFVNMEEILVC